jgi:hypothetical protein
MDRTRVRDLRVDACILKGCDWGRSPGIVGIDLMSVYRCCRDTWAGHVSPPGTEEVDEKPMTYGSYMPSTIRISVVSIRISVSHTICVSVGFFFSAFSVPGGHVS